MATQHPLAFYAVDIISDGEQIFDSGIFADGQQAVECWHERVANTVTAAREAGATGREYTVRMIREGDVIRETTVGDNGAILATLTRP